MTESIPEDVKMRIVNGYNRERSGDVAIVLKPNFYAHNPQEIQALKEMAIHMGLSAEDVDQMLNLESGASSTGSLDNRKKAQYLCE